MTDSINNFNPNIIKYIGETKFNNNINKELTHSFYCNILIDGKSFCSVEQFLIFVF